MFTVADRIQVLDQLIDAACVDSRITAAALVGSLASAGHDQWSDIDLALRLTTDLVAHDVVESWTSAMYEMHGATAHFDLWSGPTLFRVFLLRSSLQVDISFWPDQEFAPRGGPFQVVFGEAVDEAPEETPRSAAPMIGMAWLYALHARSSIGRGRGLQSLHMLNGMRDQIISLTCLRNGLPADQGRGVDQLPEPVKLRLVETIAASIDTNRLRHTFALLVDLLILEIEAVDHNQAERLRTVLAELVRTSI